MKLDNLQQTRVQVFPDQSIIILLTDQFQYRICPELILLIDQYRYCSLYYTILLLRS